MQIHAELVKKYNSQAPRYTSYPTVPLWENNLNERDWEDLVQKAFQDFGDKEGIYIYHFVKACAPIVVATRELLKTTE